MKTVRWFITAFALVMLLSTCGGEGNYFSLSDDDNEEEDTSYTAADIDLDELDLDQVDAEDLRLLNGSKYTLSLKPEVETGSDGGMCSSAFGILSFDQGVFNGVITDQDFGSALVLESVVEYDGAVNGEMKTAAHEDIGDFSGDFSTRMKADGEWENVYGCYGRWSAALRTDTDIVDGSGGSSTVPGGGGDSSPFGCSERLYCRDMSSCEEAIFYYLFCGATYMDGDNDGVPCEILCR